MKHLFFKMVIVSTLIISALNSCKKHEYLPVQDTSGGTPVIMNLTAHHWEAVGDGVFVNTFKDVISGTKSYVKVFLEANGTETLLDHPVRFENGAIWATSTETDVKIYFRGTGESALYVNIKVVIG
jgi:hypothetical protein